LALSYWQVLAAPDLNSMATNPRLAEAEQQALRGKILARDGQPLAESSISGAVQSRSYPLPAAAAITGYHSLRFGNTGLEEKYDAELRGLSGTDPLRALRERFFHTPVIGSDLVTTIDPRIQRAATDALAGQPGAIVALDPRTGEVLALASSPTFDP